MFEEQEAVAVCDRAQAVRHDDESLLALESAHSVHDAELGVGIE